jgi:hypothetical protein
MLRLPKRFPNVLLPAALILFAILANPAFASGRKPVGDTLLPLALRDSFPDAVSYAAVPIVARVTSAESALVMRSIPKPEKPRLTDPIYSSVWRVGPIPALEAIVPGAVLYRQTRYVGMGNFPEYRIGYRDSLYELTGLNRLFRHAGVSFDTSTMVERARLAVLLVATKELSDRQGRVQFGIADSVGETTVPQVSFLSTKVENPVAGLASRAVVSFDLVVHGERRREDVEFWRHAGTVVQLRMGAGLLFDDVGRQPVLPKQGEPPETGEGTQH